jgi:hypothetical protein
MGYVSLEQLQKRAEQLEKSLGESSANHNALVGRHQEVSDWLTFLKVSASELEADTAAIKES